MSNIFVDRQGEIYTINPNNYTSKKALDTVKVCFPDGKFYIHSGAICHTRKEVRQILSQESGGAWVEQTESKKRYFLDKGWIFSNICEVGKEEFFNSQNRGSFVQKVTGLALGALSLAPGIISASQHLFSSPISSQNLAITLLAVQQKNPGIVLVSASVLGQATFTSALESSPEFQVNTYTLDEQRLPDIAALADGGFVVTWMSHEQDGEDGGVFGQRFNKSGIPLGPEFQVNIYFANTQDAQTIAPLSTGGFVIAWDSEGQDDSEVGVFGRTYNSSGVPIGTEFQINTRTQSRQNNPKMVAFPSGGFVVIWEDLGGDGGGIGIFGQLYDESGTPQGSEFLVNTETQNQQENPDMALSSDETFVVTWQSFAQDGDNYGIFAQHYDRSGTPLGNEFQVNSNTLGAQLNPKITTLYNGNFLIVWKGPDQDSTGIFGQMYTNSTVPIGVELQLNRFGDEEQAKPSIAALTNGQFVVVWESLQTADSWGVYGQLLDGNEATTIGPEFRVNSFSNRDHTTSPEIQALPDGEFVVVWESFAQDGNATEIFGRLYNTNNGYANAIGSEFQINSHTANSQQNPSVTVLGSGSFVVVWESFAQDGSNLGIFGKCYGCQSNSVSSSSSYSFFPKNTSSEQIGSNSTAQSSVLTGERTSTSYLSRSASTNGGRTSNPCVSTLTTSNPSLSQPPSGIRIQYDTVNPLILDGTEIGTFTFTGGEGYLQGEDSFELYIELGNDIEDGQTIILFEIPEEEVDGWSNGTIVVSSGETSCVEGEKYSAQGEVVSQQDGTSYYQLVFQKSDCTVNTSGQLATFISISSQI